MLTRLGVAVRPRLPRSAAISTAAAAEVGGAIDYASYLTRRSRSRRPSAIRALQPLVAMPGMISLGGGMPNPSTFPFAKLTAELTDGTSVELSGASLEAALQYSPTQGLPALVAHLERLQDDEHGRASEDRQLCVTTGSADALSKAFDALLVEGDALLVESPTYSGSLAYLQPLGCRLVGVPCDGAGLQPAALEAVLAGWDEASEGARRPRVLYTIPTGLAAPSFLGHAARARSNPTGASLDAERKRDLYAVARRYGLIILEDDPYYWRATLAWMVLWRRSGGFGAARTPSLLSMDVDGRVLRFDSTSKLLASGARVGWATGYTIHSYTYSQLYYSQPASNLHTCGVAQALVAALFDVWAERHGGDASAGFASHMDGVADFYKERRDVFIDAAERHLAGLADWSVPTAGMFCWMRLRGVDDSHALISAKARDAKVLLVPGQSFMPCGSASPYVRAAYSTASPEQIDEALRRLAALLRDAEGARSD
ncbi:putative aminotransferase [Emiliania huxleyi CCMP1516]|uniref:Aminotransferase class I/classII large domain-containing protein n=2 Tax=Emiliania huxleyi TaxID=2903 RepID=A0A0D3I850_EMIH1|nr:putative aminotransferase [Emiliania huxleyi CCMP1516]EOD07435.1 putative aminotransferase [Emiliania huxleyi CCMP1516]|eukprot:XP_005759864.1 putative aminotransferase [Emiliania huxleyi CCMP1516]